MILVTLQAQTRLIVHKKKKECRGLFVGKVIELINGSLLNAIS